ncbi:4Fe-4S dicluster domain-containing protein [Methanocella arvoryzae]|nr:4Fe-4S dicluster domain-containing protein [Methanocella arvoryzae]
MASSELQAVKAAIHDIASFYGLEVVGFLRLDQARTTIPAHEMDLLRGVKWSDGEVSLSNVKNPLEIMPTAKTMVILGKRLLDDKKDIYYRVSDSYSASIETMLLDVASLKVIQALEDADFQVAEYTSYYLKVWAVLAGFGWIGKSRMFVHKNHGPRLRLKAVLTDADIGDIAEVIPDKSCGDCRECIDACPVGAIKETEVDRKLCGACKLNHRRVSENALSYCTQCTAACPIGIGKK